METIVIIWCVYRDHRVFLGFKRFFRIWYFPKLRGTFLRSPYNEDYSIFVSALGSPLFWEVTK